MSLWKEINAIPSSKADLRKFGLTLGIFFGLVGGWIVWRQHAHAAFFFSLAGFFLAFGLVLPQALKPVQKVWMALALAMGWVMSRVLLFVLFYLVFTPIGLILRVSGKDLLDIKTNVKKDSYWVPHKPRQTQDYENQF